MTQIDGDEGIHPTTAEGLAKLKPVKDGGTVPSAGKRIPPMAMQAGGTAKPIVSPSSRRTDIEIRILGFGQARERQAYMPAAPVKAAKRALDAAGLSITTST